MGILNTDITPIRAIRPRSKKELIHIINELCHGATGTVDLNDIDISGLEDLSFLFCSLLHHDVDISGWDVSKVENMTGMFQDSEFNGDISGWDVSGVIYMGAMFQGSRFNGDISKWDVSKVENMSGMFYKSQFNQDISGWDIRSLDEAYKMFANSQFNQDLSGWDMKHVSDDVCMFLQCPMKKQYLPSGLSKSGRRFY